MRVLLVDQIDDRQFLSLILHNVFDDLNLFETDTSDDAIDMIETMTPFDLIISEHDLKEGTGGEILKNFRINDRKTPFILLTKTNVKKLEEYNSIRVTNPKNTIITKPFSVKNLKQTVIDTLDGDIAVLAEENNYKKVKTGYLVRFNQAPTDLFIRNVEGKYEKVKTKGDNVSSVDLRRWFKLGAHYVYFLSNEYDIFKKTFLSRNYFMSLGLNVENDPEVNWNRSYGTISTLIDYFGYSSIVNSTVHPLVHSILNQKIGHQELMAYITKKRDLKNYVVEHSFLTGFLTSRVLVQMNWKNFTTLEAINYAAFFHHMPFYADGLEREVVAKNRNDFFSNQELFKSHPELVSRDIRRSGRFPKEVHRIVAMHHEAPRGDGFPARMVATEIDPLAAIFIVCGHFVDRIYDIEFEVMKFRNVLAELQTEFEVGRYKGVVNFLARVLSISM